MALNEMLKLVGVADDDTDRVTTRFAPESVACGTDGWRAEAIAVGVSWVEASPRASSKTSRARLVSSCRRRVVEMAWSAVTSIWSVAPSPTTSTTAATSTSTIVKPPCSETRARMKAPSAITASTRRGKLDA